MILRKHVSNTKACESGSNLKKNENRKIVRVNTILITKSINFKLLTLILPVRVVVRSARRRFSVLSPFIEKSMFFYLNAPTTRGEKL